MAQVRNRFIVFSLCECRAMLLNDDKISKIKAFRLNDLIGIWYASEGDS